MKYLVIMKFLFSVTFLLSNLAHAQIAGFSVITNSQLVYEPFSGRPANDSFQLRIDLLPELDVASTRSVDRARLRIRSTASNRLFNAQKDGRAVLPIAFENNNGNGRLNLFNGE